ncbi:unnamed protein product [Chrysoparadoxa australica]
MRAYTVSAAALCWHSALGFVQLSVPAPPPGRALGSSSTEVQEPASQPWANPTPTGERTVIMSEALPFLPRPTGLDSVKLAGDRGFDPLGFAPDREILLKRREAEVRHGRIAMLAAAGWPIAELADQPLASMLGLDSPVADNAGFSPSLLNGGLERISMYYWLGVIGLTATVELYGRLFNASAGAGYVPGDLGFDPLGLYPEDYDERVSMQEKEIKHGRIAMLAVVSFSLQEYFERVPVIDETPYFFEPVRACRATKSLGQHMAATQDPSSS